VRVLTSLWLAAASTAPTTAASAPAATGPAPGLSTADQLFLSFMFAWLVLAIVALVRSNVFSARPLRIAPARPAAMLLPLTGGILVVYILVGAIAMQVGIQTGLFSRRALGITDSAALPIPATAPHAATSSNPATWPANDKANENKNVTAGAETRVAASAPEVPSAELMWVQAVSIIAELIAAGMALVACHWLFVNGLRGMGLHLSGLGRGALVGLGALLILYPILFADDFLMSQFYKVSTHETIKEMEQTPDFMVRLGYVLVAGIGAPIAEEIFFRGIFQSALIQRFWGFVAQWPADARRRPPVAQRWGAMAVTSLLFCSVHNLDHFPILFVLSLGLGYVYERTGNLWASIFLHAGFNGITLVQVLFSNSPG